MNSGANYAGFTSRLPGKGRRSGFPRGSFSAVASIRLPVEQKECREAVLLDRNVRQPGVVIRRRGRWRARNPCVLGGVRLPLSVSERNASPMSLGGCCQNVASRFRVVSYHTGIIGFREAGELGFEPKKRAFRSGWTHVANL